MEETKFWHWTIVVLLYISSISLFISRENFDVIKVIAVVVFVVNTLLALHLYRETK